MSDVVVRVSGGREVADAIGLHVPSNWIKVSVERTHVCYSIFVFLRNGGGFFAGSGATQQEAYDAVCARIAQGPRPQKTTLLANLDIGKLDL